MSTTTSTPVTVDTNASKVPFGRLVSVEWRKMLDTRANFWLMIITAFFIVLAMAVTLLVLGLNDGLTITAQGFSQIMTIPISILLPVFAILIVTSEWSQRTHLTLFTLEPNRAKVVGAKAVAVVLFAIVTLLVAVVTGVVGNLLYGAITGNEVVWNVDGSMLAWTIVQQLLYFLMAFALASVILNTPFAVTVFYVVSLLLPLMVYSILTGLFGWARDIIPWVDFNYASAPLITGNDLQGQPTDVGLLEYGRFAFTILLWIVVPGVIGFLRIKRSEVK